MTAPAPDTLPRELGPVHFVGIGGAGMSGIARIMLARGVTVSGSDAKDSRELAALRALGADVAVGHDAAQVGAAHTVVVSAAIRPTNVEVVAARGRGLRVLHRAEALAALMAGSSVRGRGRHPRQDHDDVDAHRRAAALRCRPVLRHRRTPQRLRRQRPPRVRRRLRGRGRRERRLVPALPARHCGGHQRRPGPPRPLRGRGGLPRRLRGLRRLRQARGSPGDVRRRRGSGRARGGCPSGPAGTCAPMARRRTRTSASSTWS